MQIWARHDVWSLGAAAFLLSACASVPDTGVPSTPKTIDAYATAESFAAPVGAWPADGWWRAYGDSQLDDLIETALQGSPTLAQAKARVQKAQAAAGEAKAGTLPTLELDGSLSELKQSLNQGFPPGFQQYLPRGYHSSGYVALKFDYEFDFWGKNRAAVAAASSELRAAQAEAAEARLALSTEVALAYADLGRLYAERDVTARSVQNKQETEALVSRRLDNGLDTRAELKQAKAGAAAARAEMAAMDEQIALTRDSSPPCSAKGPDRGAAIARPAATIESFGLPPRTWRPNWSAAARRGRRPLAGRGRGQAHRRRQAQFYPNINLAAYHRSSALDANLLWKPARSIGQVGPASTSDFRRRPLRANLRGAHADYADAVASYDAALDQALQGGGGRRRRRTRARRSAKESRAALAADEEAYRMLECATKGVCPTIRPCCWPRTPCCRPAAPSSIWRRGASPSMSNWCGAGRRLRTSWSTSMPPDSI